MVEFAVAKGTVRINPAHVQCLYQGVDASTTFIIVSNQSVYKVEMPIDEVEKKLRAEISDIGNLSNTVQTLTTAVRSKTP